MNPFDRDEDGVPNAQDGFPDDPSRSIKDGLYRITGPAVRDDTPPELGGQQATWLSLSQASAKTLAGSASGQTVYIDLGFDLEDFDQFRNSLAQLDPNTQFVVGLSPSDFAALEEKGMDKVMKSLIKDFGVHGVASSASASITLSKDQEKALKEVDVLSTVFFVNDTTRVTSSFSEEDKKRRTMVIWVV